MKFNIKVQSIEISFENRMGRFGIPLSVTDSPAYAL